MSTPDDEGWSAPSLYAGGQPIFTPPTMVGADPIGSMLASDWVAGAGAADQWSATRYVGPRRLRHAIVQRYARGEINAEEHQERLDVLRGTARPAINRKPPSDRPPPTTL